MLLRHFFISRGASQEECDSLLTDGLMPPLSAFGIRIRIAKCLGLITRDVVPAFECVKDWRNHFAHEPIVEKLTAEVADELWGLIPERYQPLLSKARNVVGRQLVGKITPRWSFFIACSALDMMLLTSADVCFGNDVPGERD